MVDYDTAAAVVQDQQADPVMLAKIAYENPEFGANVAANPRCYPGLKRWIAEFGDERARQTLQAMGFAAPEGGPSTPIQQRDDAAEAQADAQAGMQASAQAAGMQEQAQAGQFYVADQQIAAGQQPVVSQQGGMAQQQAMAGQQAGMGQQAAQPATNPYGFTAEQALDPNTDQMTIARIAQYAPELRACLARNPNTYPELLDWLAQLNDPSINAALAMRQ
ncbi:hypothetical protein PT282_06405 [Bifidobacterium sp. ESL0763]|uniref:variant leucine-rich repeat-containing protein n=1 Tax=Bifidobacterium sp. ESL0763 TaxID=2983227 RepID=UPI0023F84BAE|nr:hypothetical protein [Bifidobacterium sp. ESL0763]MDF7664291.1 hypothetical protein [Bifidobacterium sp. ESL0763]